MKNKLSLGTLALLVALAGTGMSQVTIPNQDGVDITYIIDTCADVYSFDSTAERVIIPDTVVRNGVTYPVKISYIFGIDESVESYDAKTIGMPISFNYLRSALFMKCLNLDTLILKTSQPPDIYHSVNRSEAGALTNSFKQNNLFDKLTVIVPTGRLAEYRATGWGYFRKLQSPAAVWLGVGTSNPDKCPVSIYTDTCYGYLLSGDSAAAAVPKKCNAGWYEPGDTATLFVEPHIQFFTWSDHNPNPEHKYVVRGADSVTAYVPTVAYLNTNAVTMPLSSFGLLANIGGFHSSGGSYVWWNYDISGQRVPSDSATSTIFSHALWVAGVGVDSIPHAAAANHIGAYYNRRRVYDDNYRNYHYEYDYDTSHAYINYRPGPLRITDGTTDTATMIKFNHVWSVSREQIDYHIAHIADPDYTIPEDIATWPGNGDSAQGFAQQLAPFYDADGDGLYKARNGDYPLILGDQALFCIFNDNAIDGSLGIEIHAMVYAFNEPADTAMNYTVFVHYDIFNRSAQTYTDAYLGAFCDFDIGYAYDDYIGCDVEHGMFYGYNGDDNDGPGSRSFIGMSAAQSCTFLSSPSAEKHRYADTALSMSKFVYYDNSSNSINGVPVKASDYYNYLRGFWKNNIRMKFGGDGLSLGAVPLDCDFMFPGSSDPLNLGTGGVNPADSGYSYDYWTEISSGNTPHDRRGVGASGPFVFEAGQRQSIDLAFTTALTPDTVATVAVNLLQHFTDRVRHRFELGATASGRPFEYRPYSAPYNAIETINDEANQNLLIYPNPAHDRIQIAFGATKISTAVSIYNTHGQIVFCSIMAGPTASINISQLPSGIYVLRANGKVAKLVKK